jgi:hypothetical protein
MRFLLRSILALVVLASSVMAQKPESAAVPQLASTQAASRPPITLEPDASGTVPPGQIRELLRRVAEKDLENEKRLRDYTYIERQEEHRLDGRGQVKKVESRTWEILEIYGDQVERLMAKDDKPLPESEARKEEEKIQKVIDKRKNESEAERRKRLEKEEKAREEGRKFVLEVADAFNFRLAGSEALNGRDTWMLEAEPRPGYEPRGREAKAMTKFKGRIWIDKAELQWVKLDLTAIDSISFGWVLARIQKGAHLLIEQTRVNDEVWLPKYVQFHLDAKLALLKNIRADVEQTFRDYKKFRTDTKITVVGESRE